MVECSTSRLLLSHGYSRGVCAESESLPTSERLIAGGTGASRGHRPNIRQCAGTLRLWGNHRCRGQTQRRSGSGGIRPSTANARRSKLTGKCDWTACRHRLRTIHPPSYLNDTGLLGLNTYCNTFDNPRYDPACSDMTWWIGFGFHTWD